MKAKKLLAFIAALSMVSVNIIGVPVSADEVDDEIVVTESVYAADSYSASQKIVYQKNN